MTTYGPEHLPYGVFSTADSPGHYRIGVRIGDRVLDAGAAARAHGVQWASDFNQPTLNDFLGRGPAIWASARGWLQENLGGASRTSQWEALLHPLDEVTLHLPITVADYVDFYASEHHASNVGAILRPHTEALTPNWKYLPIGYHGRSSTIVVSGSDIVRPRGQRKGPGDAVPVFGPSVKLDIEAELAFIVGGETAPGHPVDIEAAGDYLFGIALFNDWSARDIQDWEYVPLGPFLGKSFASTMAAWITPMEALREARIPLPAQDPEPLAYLRGSAEVSFGLDITMSVELNGEVISIPPYGAMYWSAAQMLAHLCVNGAALSNGDVFASGTISGADRHTCGSLLEVTWNGTQPLTLADGSTRSFLQDQDVVTICATAPGAGDTVITLAEVTGRIVSGAAT